MGLEATCTARFAGKTAPGKARLESEALIFRGRFRLSIPLKGIASVDAHGGTLTVKFSEGVARFELGPQAEKWALKIRSPRSLLDKLGVKSDSTVAILGIQDHSFLRKLRERTAGISPGRPKKESDFILLAAENPSRLAKLGPLQGFLKRDGAIWVVYPKGQAHITQADVMAAAKAAGLVDGKVVSFSETHTALKLVIPVAHR